MMKKHDIRDFYVHMMLTARADCYFICTDPLKSHINLVNPWHSESSKARISALPFKMKQLKEPLPIVYPTKENTFHVLLACYNHVPKCQSSNTDIEKDVGLLTRPILSKLNFPILYNHNKNRLYSSTTPYIVI